MRVSLKINKHFNLKVAPQEKYWGSLQSFSSLRSSNVCLILSRRFSCDQKMSTGQQRNNCYPWAASVAKNAFYWIWMRTSFFFFFAQVSVKCNISSCCILFLRWTLERTPEVVVVFRRQSPQKCFELLQLLRQVFFSVEEEAKLKKQAWNHS